MTAYTTMPEVMYVGCVSTWDPVFREYELVHWKNGVWVTREKRDRLEKEEILAALAYDWTAGT